MPLPQHHEDSSDEEFLVAREVIAPLQLSGVAVSQETPIFANSSDETVVDHVISVQPPEVPTGLRVVVQAAASNGVRRTTRLLLVNIPTPIGCHGLPRNVVQVMLTPKLGVKGSCLLYCNCAFINFDRRGDDTFNGGRL